MWQGKRIGVSLILLGAFFALTSKAQAQSEQPSVAEAARKAREQKKAAPKEEKVITNETLEPPKEKPEVTTPTATEPTMPGATTSAPEGAAGGGTAAPSDSKVATAKSGDDAKKKEEEKKALEALKLQIREMKQEVNLAQRTLSLANDDYYSKPDFSKDTNGKARLDALQSDLAQKKDELAQLLAKLPAGETADEPKPADAPPQ